MKVKLAQESSLSNNVSRSIFSRTDALKAKPRRRGGSEDDNFVLLGNPIRPRERSVAPLVQFLFAWYCAYLAETTGAVDCAGLHLDCEKALLEFQGGCLCSHYPNWHFPTCLS